MDELVSVIMSTYNEELKWIQESINSILEQTYPEFEFIIILDKSDNIPLKKMLENYAEKDSRIHLIINNEHMGLAKSLNVALKHCKGKYIARMDADDISEKERLKCQKEYLERNGLDFVFSGVSVINEQSLKLFETNRKELSYNEVKEILEITNISNHPTWFLKAEIYKKFGGYRDVCYCEDYDFSLRCLSHGYRIGKMNQNVLKYRIRQNSISIIYSLEQFLNTKGILRLYKNDELKDLKKVSQLINQSKRSSTNAEKERYTKSDKIFNEAIILIKNGKKIKGIIKVVKSAFLCKYYRLKCVNILKYKFKGLTWCYVKKKYKVNWNLFNNFILH